MRKLTDSQQLGIIGGVVLVLAGLGGGGVWWTKGKIEERQAEIGAMRQKIQEAQSKIEQIPDTEQEVIILRENLFEYVKILPEEQELNNFVRITNEFVGKSGVHMRQYLPGKESNAKGSAFSRYTYKFELSATLWQFMQFMNEFESYERFVQVKDFQLSSGKTNASGDTVHSVSMTVESYVYTGKATGKDVAIPNYSNKVDKLQEEIFKARQQFSNEDYRFEGARGRRDIFIDPRESSAGGPSLGGPSPREQQRILDRMRAGISDCQEIYELLQDPSLTIFRRYQLDRDLREKVVDLGTEIDDVQAKGYIRHLPLRQAWTREVVEPLTTLRRHLNKTLGTPEKEDPWLTEPQLRDLIDAMAGDLKVGDIVTAMDRYQSVGDQLNIPSDNPRYELRLSVETVYLRAKLAQEFSGLRLDISGVCVNDIGKSGLILNGIVYQEGEYVDNNLLIKAVDRERIEFIYKGFTVVRTL